ncbi:hypothetical protein MY905_01570 [Haemophilus influenzae]|uniref:Dcs4 n=1 Tax=Haemophilus influenzae TaxID=727 RepID=F5A8A5_HAEIF|nr:Dcs4 [Haemophilus influenzae]AEK12219.1 DcsD [Haemophilus influenzae]MCK9045379.1 hypothetical protein [Haemophilus influenzae]
MKNNVTNFLYIKRPIIEGNKVLFDWNIDYDNDISPNSIYIDYYDLDISEVPLQVHYNTIIGLLLNKLRNSQIDTIVVTEDCISQEIVKFWLSYHSLSNVYFANIGDISLGKSYYSTKPGSVGILYGGGKDSYYTLDILSRNNYIKQVNIISFVIPDSHVNVKQLEERRDNLILKPISDKYDINIIKIKTDARVVIKGYHLELYFAPLGVLAWLNKFEFVTFSYEYCHYFTHIEKQATFGFERSQISYLKALSKFYSEYFSENNLTIFNANQHLSELSSFGYLVKTNPKFYQTLVMCEATVEKDKKWCCSCTKCAEFTLFSLFYNLEQSDIDVDWFFSESPWINKIIKELENQSEKGKFIKGLTFTLHFDSFKFVITKLKDKNISFKNQIANKNFNILAEHYYDDKIKNEDCFYSEIFNLVYPQELKEGSLHLLNKYLPISEAPKEKSSGIGTLYFDPSIQPKLGLFSPKIDPTFFFSKITKAKQYSHFTSDSVSSYISSYSLLNLGTLTTQDISFSTNQNYLDIWINKDPLKKDDGYKIELHIKVNKQFTYGAFKLEIPFFRKELNHRLECFLNINNSLDKLSLSERRNLTCHFSLTEQNIKNGFISIILSMKAIKALEPWKWGNACRIRLSEIKLYANKLQYNLNSSKIELEFK